MISPVTQEHQLTMSIMVCVNYATIGPLELYFKMDIEWCHQHTLVVNSNQKKKTNYTLEVVVVSVEESEKEQKEVPVMVTEKRQVIFVNMSCCFVF